MVNAQRKETLKHIFDILRQVLSYKHRTQMFWINDYDSTVIIKKEFRKNNSSNIIIHEHDFAQIILKDNGQQSVICLTCGSSYCETSGKLLVSTMRTGKFAIDK